MHLTNYSLNKSKLIKYNNKIVLLMLHLLMIFKKLILVQKEHILQLRKH